ncbi:MAG: alpha-amylase family glycosyl hydrolase [Bacteroidales bacterium]|nr:alpha-amylase family glycosyl hydrolase [Bacteroidales bacterium]MDZ4203316.1 alpha-amylase family glycosyl hydrolase [Bacteroidales bacterium]
MKEDYQPGFHAGTAPTIAPVYKVGAADDGLFSIGKSGYQFAQKSLKDYEEHERFTPDTHWMPRVVLLAKNAYVWLDQLSKKHQREIRRLDQIPDEELDQLARWNFNGLWLIGIWERSDASKRIKHIMGNIDAVSSAYSLYDYEIATDLGGEQAYQSLNERAKGRGIRLASDMVPNHTGLYSKWVIEHPDYFIQTHVSPFPGYGFAGENLSLNPDVEIRIEDGYYSRSDAAVVFRRIDKNTGDVRYIYHGNDGTNMPWNDTAQLDMLKREVREAVIQKIFDVAHRFSIIRFDAAMTLAKKHFARLWYPRPGSGGDIPSRADFAMSEEDFDAMFPVEFWREVVDRINRDLPETLLLAEAFWLMEGYFVRTLGMHRVYNSAFMHMLKNEENEKYRDLITNTLEFEPEILKRYVNFMSNPDEETAIHQFGSDGKYFGVCVLMTTLPGLPMFAHGQVEGYTEKYGMEYQRAYYNELPNQGLIERHQREIFPLTQQRYIFSDVDHFNIFDFISEHGHVNENVFAYTNKSGNERALVLFNNKYESTTGKIFTSAPKLSRQGAEKATRSIGLGEALSLNKGDKIHYIFKEYISGLEFLRSSDEIHQHGFSWGLQGFEYRVFMDFRETHDDNGAIEKLCAELNGTGVQNIEEKLTELEMQPLHDAFEHLLADDVIDFVIRHLIKFESETTDEPNLAFITQRFEVLLDHLRPYLSVDTQTNTASSWFADALKSIHRSFDFVWIKQDLLGDFFSKVPANSLEDMLTIGSKNLYRENVIIFMAYLVLDTIQAAKENGKGKYEPVSGLLLHKSLHKILQRTGRGENDIDLDITLIGILLRHPNPLFCFSEFATQQPPDKLPEHKVRELLEWLDDPWVKNFIGTNQYEQVWYYSKENFEELVGWLFTASLFCYFKEDFFDNNDPELAISVFLQSAKLALLLKETSEKSGYKYEKLKQNIEMLSRI